MSLLEDQGRELMRYLQLRGVEENAGVAVQSNLLKLLLSSLLRACVLADSELKLAVVACEV